MFDNYIIDLVMPKVSPNEWKCLCLIIRKTIGWHKEHDELSFSQIKKGTGIKSNTTVADALKELEKAGYITVDRFVDDQWKSNIYALNLDFELEVESGNPGPKNKSDDFSTENGLESLSPKNGLTASPKNGPGLSTESGHTKEKVNKSKKEKGAVAPGPSEEKIPIPAAVSVYRKVARRFPDKAMWPAISESVGESPEQLEFWEKVVLGWIGCGWNKLNIKGMLSLFKDRRIPTTEPNNAHPEKPKTQRTPEQEALVRKYEEESRSSSSYWHENL